MHVPPTRDPATLHGIAPPAPESLNPLQHFVLQWPRGPLRLNVAVVGAALCAPPSPSAEVRDWGDPWLIACVFYCFDDGGGGELSFTGLGTHSRVAGMALFTWRRMDTFTSIHLSNW